jgi:hypothetical protein
VKKPVKSSQKKFLFFLNTNPLPPVSLGFLNRQSQIPFRQAASADFSQLSQFVHYAQKRFDLSLLAGCFADRRPQPGIPSRAVGLSLVLGEVVHIPSLLQLQEETKVPQWQQWVGYRHPISHDTFGYVSERLDPEHPDPRLIN